MTMTPEQWAAALAKIEELLNRPPPPFDPRQTTFEDWLLAEKNDK